MVYFYPCEQKQSYINTAVSMEHYIPMNNFDSERGIFIFLFFSQVSYFSSKYILKQMTVNFNTTFTPMQKPSCINFNTKQIKVKFNTKIHVFILFC